MQRPGVPAVPRPDSSPAGAARRPRGAGRCASRQRELADAHAYRSAVLWRSGGPKRRATPPHAHWNWHPTGSGPHQGRRARVAPGSPRRSVRPLPCRVARGGSRAARRGGREDRTHPRAPRAPIDQSSRPSAAPAPLATLGDPLRAGAAGLSLRRHQRGAKHEPAEGMTGRLGGRARSCHPHPSSEGGVFVVRSHPRSCASKSRGLRQAPRPDCVRLLLAAFARRRCSTSQATRPGRPPRVAST